MTSASYATPKILTGKDKDAAMVGFVVLAGSSSPAWCLSIFGKFFAWDLGGLTFEQSVRSSLPLTFLVTDLASEIYGKRKANLVVLSGLAASLMVLLIVSLAGAVEATAVSSFRRRVDHVFGQTALAVGASMATTSWRSSSMCASSTSGNTSPTASTCGCETICPPSPPKYWTPPPSWCCCAGP